MFSSKEKTLKDEKKPHLIENISDSIQSSSSKLPTNTINSNTIFTPIEISEPVIAGEEEDIKKNEKNIYLKMLINDNNNDHLYDSIYDTKIYEKRSTSILSPAGSLCDLEGSECINYKDDQYKLTSTQNDQINFYLFNGMDTPISHGSPAMPEESDENITSKDCIPPIHLHIHSQSNDFNESNIISGTTIPNNNYINSYDDDDDDNNDLDKDFDMEKLQPININENTNVGVKRKMETYTTNSPIKKKRPNLKINTSLEAPKHSEEIMTAQVVEDILQLQEETEMLPKFDKIDNYDMRYPSPTFDESTTNMSINNNDLHQMALNPSSPLLDVGTENCTYTFFGQINNNNSNNNNIYKDSISIDNESITNQSFHKIKDENPPSVASSLFMCLSSDDYTCSTLSPLSCQTKRRRGRPRIVHRLEPTPSELRDLSEQDKKQKILRAKNNKASQSSRDKKRSKIQDAETQKKIEETRNKELKRDVTKLNKMLTVYKNVFQKFLLNKT